MISYSMLIEIGEYNLKDFENYMEDIVFVFQFIDSKNLTCQKAIVLHFEVLFLPKDFMSIKP